jgi:hypothetical protein
LDTYEMLAKSSLDLPGPRLDISTIVSMALARTILAVLIAASVALLPAAGGAAFKLQPSDAAEMSAAEPMHDCCPPDANPCGKAMDNCGSMAACALKCFSFAGGTSSLLQYPLTPAGLMPLFESDGFRPQTGSPPFRPPRI